MGHKIKMKKGRIVVNFFIFVSTKFHIKVIQVIFFNDQWRIYIFIKIYRALSFQHAADPMVLSTLKYCEMIHT